MSFKPFRKIRIVSDEDLSTKNINTMQDNFSAALSQVLGKDQLDSAILKNVVLTAGINKVPHKLGRQLNGYIITRVHGGYAWVYDTQDTNDSPHLLLYLMSATNVTCDFLVF